MLDVCRAAVGAVTSGAPRPTDGIGGRPPSTPWAGLGAGGGNSAAGCSGGAAATRCTGAAGAVTAPSGPDVLRFPNTRLISDLASLPLEQLAEQRRQQTRPGLFRFNSTGQALRELAKDLG